MKLDFHSTLDEYFKAKLLWFNRSHNPALDNREVVKELV